MMIGMKRINVRYFASVREAMGTDGETVETQAASLGELRDELIARGGAHARALVRGQPMRMALDQVMRPEDMAIADGSEVAFFPPVTGG